SANGQGRLGEAGRDHYRCRDQPDRRARKGRGEDPSGGRCRLCRQRGSCGLHHARAGRGRTHDHCLPVAQHGAGRLRPAQSFSPPDTPRFRQLWQDQDGLCALCGKPMPPSRADVAHSTLWKKWRPTFDHIIPRAHEGSDEISNLRLAHAICNKRRGTGKG
ncbi:unnamed protein product, partial [Scytosiphon promiscuus]